MSTANNCLVDPVSDKDIDLVLVRKVQAGDNSAFDVLVLKYQHRIANLVLRLVRDYDEVPDVTQEIFINAYRGLKNFRGDSAFYTWLYRIGMNTARTHLLRLSRRPPRSGVVNEDADQYDIATGLCDIADPFSELVTDQIAATVEKTINTLSEDLQAAITLRELEGLSYEEIAVVMECPIGTVRSRIFRAREAIEQQLQLLLENNDDTKAEYKKKPCIIKKLKKSDSKNTGENGLLHDFGPIVQKANESVSCVRLAVG